MARKETLELEIKTLIENAQKNVKVMQDEIKRLADSAKKAAPETKAVARALNRANGKEIKRAAAEMKLFGGSTAAVKKQLAIMKEAMIDLVDDGLEPASDEVQKLLKEYKKLEVESNTLAKKTEAPVEGFASLQQAVMQSASAIALLKISSVGLRLAGGALEAADAFESARGELGILLGDMEAGAALFDEMQRFNIKTPFDLATIKQGTSMLLAAKTSLKDMNRRLTLFGNLSQGNSQKFISFINAFSKASAKGKADMEVLNVYIDQGVQIFDALAEVVGKTAKEIPKMASEGKISFDDLNAALANLTAQGGSYYGAMELGAKSLQGRKDALRESVKGLAASYGQMLMPAVKGVLNVLNKMVNAINESPILKGVLAAAIMGVVTVLGILTVKMIASTVKTWAAFAAQQALNTALAATNPLLLAGVAAVTAAVGAAVVYASKQQKAAEAAHTAALANKKVAEESAIVGKELEMQAEAAKKASNAYAEYEKALRNESLAEVVQTIASLKKELNGIADSSSVLPELTAQVEDLYKKIEIAEQILQEKKNAKASSFKESWQKEWAAFNRSRSGNPFAQVEFEKKKKLEEAYRSFVRKGNQKTLDEIAELYKAKREKIQVDIIMADREALAKMTKTRVDDLQIRRDKELASFKGTQEMKLRLAEYWEKKITEQQKKEIDARAAAEKKAAEKDRSSSASGAAQGAALGAISDTEVGQMMAGKHPGAVIVESLMKAVRKIENVNKVLNPFTTIFDRMVKVIAPLVNNLLQPFVDILTDIGVVLGQVLSPILAVMSMKYKLIATAINFVLIPLKLLGQGFEWLHNTVIVPVGNTIIAIINGIISAVNMIPFVNIRKLDYFGFIGDKAKEIAEAMELRKKEITAMYERQKDRVKDELAAQIDSLKAQYELGLMSRKEYERKAEDYHSAADKELLTIEKKMATTLEHIEANTHAALSKTQKEIAQNFTIEKRESHAKKWGKKVPILGHIAGAAVDLGAGAVKTVKSIGSKIKSFFGFASGTPEIPHDLIAQVHKGEMIIPRTFAEGVRSGDVTISGGRGQRRKAPMTARATMNVYVTVNVEGSVIKKDDLVEEIYSGISDGIKKGRLDSFPESA